MYCLIVRHARREVTGNGWAQAGEPKRRRMARVAASRSTKQPGTLYRSRAMRQNACINIGIANGVLSSLNREAYARREVTENGWAQAGEPKRRRMARVAASRSTKQPGTLYRSRAMRQNACINIGIANGVLSNREAYARREVTGNGWAQAGEPKRRRMARVAASRSTKQPGTLYRSRAMRQNACINIGIANGVLSNREAYARREVTGNGWAQAGEPKRRRMARVAASRSTKQPGTLYRSRAMRQNACINIGIANGVLSNREAYARREVTGNGWAQAGEPKRRRMARVAASRSTKQPGTLYRSRAMRQNACINIGIANGVLSNREAYARREVTGNGWAQAGEPKRRRMARVAASRSTKQPGTLYRSRAMRQNACINIGIANGVLSNREAYARREVTGNGWAQAGEPKRRRMARVGSLSLHKATGNTI